jgi:N6-adenosine-specific RNA methylase IME4
MTRGTVSGAVSAILDPTYSATPVTSEPKQSLPIKRYDLILADPPWRYAHAASKSRQVENHYHTMVLDDICALPVRQLVAPGGCVLLLWTTAPKLEEAFRVINAWGFSYKTGAVWRKTGRLGMGHYWRIDHEHLLLATTPNTTGMTPEPRDRRSSVMDGLVRRHSQKPDEVMEQIDRMWPFHQKLELFARSARLGWDAWGDECEGGITFP